MKGWKVFRLCAHSWICNVSTVFSSPVTVKLENVLLTVETNEIKSEVSHKNDSTKSLNNDFQSRWFSTACLFFETWLSLRALTSTSSGLQTEKTSFPRCFSSSLIQFVPMDFGGTFLWPLFKSQLTVEPQTFNAGSQASSSLPEELWHLGQTIHCSAQVNFSTSSSSS